MNCIIHGITKSRTWLNDFHFSSFYSSPSILVASLRKVNNWMLALLMICYILTAWSLKVHSLIAGEGRKEGHFFLWKISKGLSFNAGCFVSMWQSSCEGLMTSLIVSRHVLEKAGLENVNHLLQWTHNLNRTLGIFFKMQLSFCWQS